MRSPLGRFHLALALGLGLPAAGLAAPGVRPHELPAPGQLAPAVVEQLGQPALEIFEEAAGMPLWTLWPAAAPAHRPVVEAAPDRTFADLQLGTLVGALRLGREWRDYRDQVVPPGIYTLRYAVQPVLKEHLRTAPFRDFLLLVPAGADNGTAQTSATWIARSRGATATGHPAVLALVPGTPPTGPRLIVEGDRWLLALGRSWEQIELVVHGHALPADL